MPNTLTNTALQIYGNKLIVGLKRKLAPIFAFSLDLSDEAKSKGDTVNVGLITAASAADFHATNNNYKAAEGDIQSKKVTLDKRKLSKFGVTDAQNANYPASWWERKAEMCVNAVGGAALDDIWALITADNFGDGDNDKLALTLAGFKKSGVAAIRAGAIKKGLNISACSLCLNPDFFSALLADLDAWLGLRRQRGDPQRRDPQPARLQQDHGGDRLRRPRLRLPRRRHRVRQPPPRARRPGELRRGRHRDRRGLRPHGRHPQVRRSGHGPAQRFRRAVLRPGRGRGGRAPPPRLKTPKKKGETNHA
jgi:hypothetical protein